MHEYSIKVMMLVERNNLHELEWRQVAKYLKWLRLALMDKIRI